MSEKISKEYTSDIETSVTKYTESQFNVIVNGMRNLLSLYPNKSEDFLKGYETAVNDLYDITRIKTNDNKTID